MRDIPIPVLLSWPIPNYINPPTRGPTLVIVNAILISLVVVVVLLRIYTRIAIKRWFGADDVFIALALLATIGLTTCVILANQRYCWGRHVWDIPFSILPSTGKVAFVAKILYTFAATFTRLSIFSFYYRLVRDSGKDAFTWAVHANVAYSIAIFITFICLTLFQCNPIRAYWTYGERGCMDEGPVTLAAGIINCTADFFATVTPIPLVLRLQMQMRQRVAVLVLFSLGFVVTVAGAVRTWFIHKSLMESYDETWYAYSLWISAAVEIDLGVICASAPVLRPLLAKLPLSLSSLSSKLSSKLSSARSSKRHSSTLHSTQHLPAAAAAAIATRPPHGHHHRTVSDELLDKADDEEAFAGGGGSGDAEPLDFFPWHDERGRMQDQDFEMKKWGDVERAARWDSRDEPSRSGSGSESQQAILGSEDERDGARGGRKVEEQGARGEEEEKEEVGEEEKQRCLSPQLASSGTKALDGTGGGSEAAKAEEFKEGACA